VVARDQGDLFQAQQYFKECHAIFSELGAKLNLLMPPTTCQYSIDDRPGE